MKKRILSWLIILSMLIPTAAPTPAYTIAGGQVPLYVDAASGSDTVGNGSSDQPFKTLQKAITTAQSDFASDAVILYLKEGAYPVSVYVNHFDLTIEAQQSTPGVYDEVTLYPDYATTQPKPYQLWTDNWIIAAVSLSSKLGLTLSHLTMTADDPSTPETETGSSLTPAYAYSADGPGSYITADHCIFENAYYGIYQTYSEPITINILNTSIEAKIPASMTYGAILNIDNSTLKQSSGGGSSSILDLSSVGTVNVTNSILQGNGDDDYGFRGYFSVGTINNNQLLGLKYAMDLEDLITLTVSNNYVETSSYGFDFETKYNSVAAWSITGNTIVKTTPHRSEWEIGIDLYLDDYTGGSTFNVCDNEIINFPIGLNFDGYSYSIEDQVALTLSNDGKGNTFRGNILNMVIDDLRTAEKLDVCGTDWGTEVPQEVMDRIYFDDSIPSLISNTEASTHNDLFLFDDVFTTSAPEDIYIDDDLTSADMGYGITHFATIGEGKARLRSGGTLHIADGAYEEQVFIYQPMTITGSDNAVLTNKVDGTPSAQPAMLIAAPNTTVSGMSFKDGAAAVMVGDFDNCISQLNQSFGFSYYDSIADNATLSDNRFIDQTGYPLSFGVNYLSDLDNFVLQNNVFSNTNTTINYVFYSGNTILNSPKILGNQILNGYAGAFRMDFIGHAQISQNQFYFNDDTESIWWPNLTGIYVSSTGGHAVISENLFAFDSALNSAFTCTAVELDFPYDQSALVTYDAFDNDFVETDQAFSVNPSQRTVEDTMTTVTIGGSNENANDFSGAAYGVVSQLKPASVDGTYNIWGVEDSAIPNKIMDVNDSIQYGEVTYLPSATVIVTPPTLSGLAADGLTLSPTFHPDTLDYTATTSYSHETALITATTSDGAIWINGEEVTTDGVIEIALEVGENTITIEVREDALKTTYTLSITREAAPEDPVDPVDPVDRDRDHDDDKPAPPVVVTATIGKSTWNTVTAAPKVEGGVDTVLITTAMTEALLEKAADTEGTDAPDVLNVAVTSGTATEPSELEVSLFQSNLKKIVDQSDASLQITAPWIAMTFDAKALETIHAANDGGEITFAASTIDPGQLSAADQVLVEGRPVYDLTVKNGDEVVSEFGGGYATVRIPYELKDGESPESIVVFVLMDDGSLEAVRGYYDAAEGTVVFKTPHFSKFVISHNPVAFRDVTAGAWYREAVSFIAARGITSGIADGLFAPQESLTRAQFVVMLLKAYGIEAEDAAEAGASTLIVNFTDAGNTYYTNALYTAKALGIAKGIGSNLFAPDRSISREEMLVLLYNALTVMNEMPAVDDSSARPALESFADAALVSEWAKPGISEMIRNGVISGADNRIMPKDMTTRAEMAQVLYQLLGR